MTLERILTANEIVFVVRFRNYRGWIEHEAGRRQGKYPNWHLDKSLPPLPAFVESSTWVWQCPCGSLWWAEPTFPRAWCPECGNEHSGGFARLLVFPPERTKIERLLKVRPDAKTRNWIPHETASMLLAENIAHGV